MGEVAYCQYYRAAGGGTLETDRGCGIFDTDTPFANSARLFAPFFGDCFEDLVDFLRGRKCDMSGCPAGM